MVESPSAPKDVADTLEALARRLRTPTLGTTAQPTAGGEVEVTPWITSDAQVDEAPFLGEFDIVNDGCHVALTAEALNVDPSDVHVSLTTSRLLVGLGDGENAIRREVPLPRGVDSDGAVATLRNGVLDVVLPLRAPPA